MFNSPQKNPFDLKLFFTKTKRVLAEFLVPEEANNFLPLALRPKYLFWYGAGLLVFKIAIISWALVLSGTTFLAAINSQNLLAMINEARSSQNLSPLAVNTKLSSTATLKVSDMLTNGYFAHTSPTGVSPWYWFKQAGYNYEYAGENLAMDFFDTQAVFTAWMNSPSHRANILNPNFNEIGIAVGSGQLQNRETTLAVLSFGSQSAASSKTQTPSPSPSKTPATTPKTTATPKGSPAPSFAPSLTPSVAPETTAAPSATPEDTIALKTLLENQSQNIYALTPTEKIITPQTLTLSSRVLGTFTSRGDEMAQSLYLYFTLFLIAALCVNLFVKIKIQYWPNIAATTILIILSGILIFI